MKHLVFFIVVIFFGVLSSCGNSRHVTHTDHSSQEMHDSVRYVERVIVDTHRVPAETLEFKIPVKVLEIDTHIVYKNGRVKTEIRYVNGNIDVQSTCDSLEKLVISTQSELEKFKNKSTEKRQTTTEKVVIGIPTFYKVSAWICGALILALIIYIIYRIVKKKFKSPLGT